MTALITLPFSDPSQAITLGIAAVAAWLAFGPQIKQAQERLAGKMQSDDSDDLYSLVKSADRLIRHFERIGDSEGATAARSAAGRLFAGKEQNK